MPQAEESRLQDRAGVGSQPLDQRSAGRGVDDRLCPASSTLYRLLKLFSGREGAAGVGITAISDLPQYPHKASQDTFDSQDGGEGLLHFAKRGLGRFDHRGPDGLIAPNQRPAGVGRSAGEIAPGGGILFVRLAGRVGDLAEASFRVEQFRRWHRPIASAPGVEPSADIRIVCRPQLSDLRAQSGRLLQGSSRTDSVNPGQRRLHLGKVLMNLFHSLDSVRQCGFRRGELRRLKGWANRRLRWGIGFGQFRTPIIENI
jgi:hypothetical protein